MNKETKELKKGELPLEVSKEKRIIFKGTLGELQSIAKNYGMIEMEKAQVQREKDLDKIVEIVRKGYEIEKFIEEIKKLKRYRMNKEIELKTLKDLESDCFCNVFGKDIISQKELKAEAIKWVKFYSKDPEDENAQFIRMWIWKFFNLTEKDTDTQEGKAAQFENPIVLSDVHFNEIIEHMKKTHNLNKISDTVDKMRRTSVNFTLFSSPREILQVVGTEIIRGICPSYHVDVLEKIIVKNPSQHFVITDSRYPNEREMLKKKGAILCLVKRKEVDKNTGSHASENSLGIDTDYDFYIENDTTIEGLYKNIKTILLDIYLTKDKK